MAALSGPVLQIVYDEMHTTSTAEHHAAAKQVVEACLKAAIFHCSRNGPKAKGMAQGCIDLQRFQGSHLTRPLWLRGRFRVLQMHGPGHHLHHSGSGVIKGQTQLPQGTAHQTQLAQPDYQQDGHRKIGLNSPSDYVHHSHWSQHLLGQRQSGHGYVAGEQEAAALRCR